MAAPRSHRLNQPAPPPFVVEPSSGHHNQSVILLYGLGNNGQAFGKELLTTGHCSNGQTLAEALPDAKFIFPTSRWRRPTVLKRALVTTWFDKASFENPFLHSHIQVSGLEESGAEIMALVQNEVDVVGSKNVLLGGISQGCATSLITLLLLRYPIAGCVGLSGYLPFCRDMEQLLDADQDGGNEDDGDVFERAEPVMEVVELDTREDDKMDKSPADQVFDFVRDLITLPNQPTYPRGSALSTPLFLGHGTADEKVKHEFGERTRDVLRGAGFEVTWKSYEGLGHEYKVPKGIDDIVEFIRTRAGWMVSSHESKEQV